MTIQSFSTQFMNAVFYKQRVLMLIFVDGVGRTRSRRTYHRLLLEINKQIMSKTLMTEK